MRAAGASLHPTEGPVAVASMRAEAPLSGTSEREFTLRAVSAGVVLGAVLAAANVYSGLKTAFVDGGNITASVLAFAFFAAFRRRGPAFSSRETNLTQTIAASAAVMSMVVGVNGPIAALALGGHTYAPSVLVAWGLALSVLGIAVGALLRPRLVEGEGLPFPTGTATAEVIFAMASGGSTAARRARALVLSALFAAAVTWFRDGPKPMIPQAWLLPGAVFGVTLASLSAGLSVSPLMAATGALVGLRGATSMLLGLLIAWGVLAPALLHAGVFAGDDHGALAAWLTWPGAALMLASSLTSLVLQWRSLARGARDVWRLVQPPARSVEAAPRARRRPTKPTVLGAAAVLASVALVVALASFAFGVTPAVALLAVLLSVLLAVVVARSAGETDIAPVGSMGTVTQIAFAGSAGVGPLLCGSVVAGEAAQTASILWAFKSGQKLGASPRAQVLGQLLGALVGALVVVPTYAVVVSAYGLGSERLPAPGAMSWRATAEAVSGGLSTLPAHAPAAAASAFVLGVVLTLLAETRCARVVPSPVALGIAFLLPASLTAAMFVGAVVAALVAWWRPAWAAEHLGSVAGGAIAGESIFAVVMAALVSAGILAS